MIGVGGRIGLLVCGLAIWAAMALPAGAAAPHRVALVIGIGAYAHLPKLGNTVGDATLIAAKLRAAGFDVDLETDLGKDALARAVRDFGRRVEAAGPDAVAALYYAGHGVQDDKQANYLIGDDADLRSQVDLPLEALSLDTTLQTIEAARPAMTFVILDACRDNPLPVSDRRSAKRGLAVEAEQRGLLIAFSTEPGKTALDAPDGGHSPFATALADALDTPGLEVAQMFKLVTRNVLDATHEEQFPWVTQRLVEDFYFVPGATPPTPQAVIAVATATATATLPRDLGADDQSDAGEIAYGQAVIRNDPDGYEAWLARFPTHKRKTAVLALLQRLREEDLWKRGETASASEATSVLETELIAFPDGVYADRARQRLTELRAATGAALPSEPGSLATPAETSSPGFDCAKARLPVERQICATPSLALLDRDAVQVFGRALAQAPAPLDLQRDEDRWLRQRNACADRGATDAVIACVSQAYGERIALLKGLDPTAAPVTVAGDTTPSFPCRAAQAPAERLICTTPTLAADDRTLAALYGQAHAGAGSVLEYQEGQWRQGRDACGALSDRNAAIGCIDQAYRRRIAELGGNNDAGGRDDRPSFDCARARHPVERLICATPQLARADRLLAATVTQARQNPRSAAQLGAGQTAWLSSRNNCATLGDSGAVIACVARAYGRRTAEAQAKMQ